MSELTLQDVDRIEAALIEYGLGLEHYRIEPEDVLALCKALRAAWAENLALWEMMFRIALGANLPSAESIAVELVKRQSVNLPPKNSAPERSADDAMGRGG